MKNHNKIKIPKKYKTYQEKVNFLTQEIMTEYSEGTRLDTSATAQAIRLGALLIELKKLVKGEEKIEWTKFIKKKLPAISLRTIQRYMKMALKVDLDSCPSLAHLGQVRLSDLISHSGEGVTVNDFLEDKEIETDIDPEEEKAIFRFRREVDALLKKLEGEGADGEDPSEGEKPKAKTQKPRDRADVNHVMQFEVSSKALTANIDSIIEDKELLSEIDTGWVEDLLEKLTELKEMLDELDQ